MEVTHFSGPQLSENEYADLLSAISFSDQDDETVVLWVPVMEGRVLLDASSLKAGDQVAFDQIGEDVAPEKWQRAQRIDGLSNSDHLIDSYAINLRIVSQSSEVVSPVPDAGGVSEAVQAISESIPEVSVSWEGGVGPVETAAMSASSFLEPVTAEGIPPVEAITQLARAIEARGMSFLYLSIPLRSEIYPEWFGRDVDRNGRSARDEVLEALADRGVEVFDAGEVLRREKSQVGDEFRPFWKVSDSHLTPQGHAVIARELGRYLSEKGWLAEVRPEDFEVSEIVLEAPGDASLTMTVRQVPVPKTNPQSPIFMAGDSNLYFYQTAHATGCGLPSQLAAETGHYVDWKSIAGMQPHTFGKYGAGVFHGKKLVIFVHTAWLLHDERSPMLPVTLQSE